MKVLYLGHSGFLIETQYAYYLFDYIRGTLPVFSSDQPLYVFASHSHEDHFMKNILWDKRFSNVTNFIFSDDIRRKIKHSLKNFSHSLISKIIFVKADCEVSLEHCKILPLKSTDIGVAFTVKELKSGQRFYHAGDLNWWHWNGEPKAWNRNMEVNYKREIDKISEFTFDVAFVPLDPRLEDSYYFGMGYFLEKVHAKHVFPMHFWKDYTVIPKYISEHGGREVIEIIEREEQEYAF